MEFFEEGIKTDFGSDLSRLTFQSYDLRSKDPKYLAAYNLNRALMKYPDFTEQARTNIQNEFLDMPDLAVLNIDTLAAVLAFLKNYPEPTPETFQDEIILEYFENLIPNKPQKNINMLLKAQFLKYIRAIKTYQGVEELEEESEEAEVEDTQEEEEAEVEDTQEE